jgi:hypothetical protein
VLGTGHHRLSIGTTSAASANDCQGRCNRFQLGPRTSGIGASTSPPRGLGEVALPRHCGRSQPLMRPAAHALKLTLPERGCNGEVGPVVGIQNQWPRRPKWSPQLLHRRLEDPVGRPHSTKPPRFSRCAAPFRVCKSRVWSGPADQRGEPHWPKVKAEVTANRKSPSLLRRRRPSLRRRQRDPRPRTGRDRV